MSSNLRIWDVAKKTSLAKSTIWLWVKQKKFPKPYKISERVTVWDEAEVDQWIIERKKHF